MGEYEHTLKDIEEPFGIVPVADRMLVVRLLSVFFLAAWSTSESLRARKSTKWLRLVMQLLVERLHPCFSFVGGL
jgi:hypothetical protein